MNIQTILGILSIILIFPGQYFYITSILQGKTKPHLYTLCIFFILMSLGFIIQIQHGAGPGAWLTGAIALMQVVTLFISYKHGFCAITKIDTYILLAALSCIPVYIFLEEKLYALILLIIIDILGFIPTIRKTLVSPDSEDLKAWNISILRSAFSIGGVHSLSVYTILYPIIILVGNIVMSGIIIKGRKGGEVK